MLPIERRNARWWHVLNATTRLVILRGATRPFVENIIVNEYPKSGGSWLSQMVSEAMGLPYPRNRLPMLSSCLMQCHILNPLGMRNVVVVWRDGRDVAVSLYHHLLLGHEYAGRAEAQRTLKRLGIVEPEDVRAHLPRFIELMMTGKAGPSFTWPQFVENWHGRTGVTETRYEDILSDPASELQKIVSRLAGHELDADQIAEIVERYSFKAQSGRRQGEEKRGSFMRKGIAGDWVNYFSSEATEVFNFYAGDALAALEY
ncbi:sulfotransferase domain-containing protein [Burkholderiaceae bacterium]|nr:sulfotransferase domain-containing protein [Burkholderiaceae bacterium]